MQTMRYCEFRAYYQLDDTLENYAKYLYYRSPFVKSLPETDIKRYAKSTWAGRYEDAHITRAIKK